MGSSPELQPRRIPRRPDTPGHSSSKLRPSLSKYKAFHNNLGIKCTFEMIFASLDFTKLLPSLVIEIGENGKIDLSSTEARQRVAFNKTSPQMIRVA